MGLPDSKHSEEFVRLYRLCEELYILGYSFAQWFSDNGFHAITIYSEKEYEDLARPIIQSFLIQGSPVITSFISDVPFRLSFNFSGDFKSIDFLKFDGDRLEKNKVVFAITMKDSFLQEWSSDKNIRIIKLSNIVSRVRMHAFLERPLLSFFSKHQQLGLTICTLGLPVFPENNLSHYEENIVRNGIRITTMNQDIRKGILPTDAFRNYTKEDLIKNYNHT
jgi:hypothetical protein